MPATPFQPEATSLSSPSRALPVSPRWSSVAVAWLLVACVHSPQAAVQPAGPDLGEMSVTGEPLASVAACQETPMARSALVSVTRELQTQGMALHAACKTSSQGWVVQVRVLDGIKASKVVRGPLAEGQDVDMGTPSGVALTGASPASRGFSPDVQHNRQWLRALMARHQFDNLPDAWWHFAQRGTAPAHDNETDLAAR